MKLVELLDELRSNLLRDASTLKDGPPDHYWSDATLVRYINEAHRRFARRSLCIAEDNNPEVTQVPLEDGRAIYTLHSAILDVVSARHQDALADLVRVTHRTTFAAANPFTDSADWSGAANVVGSQPQRFATDEGMEVGDEHQIRMLFDPTPDSTQVGKVVHLRVRRLPLESFSLENTEQEAEIPEDWQLDMLEWAAWRAFRNWDLDGEDRKKADEHRMRFEEAIKECRHEVEQRKMAQPPTWAFGQNGFSYVR